MNVLAALRRAMLALAISVLNVLYKWLMPNKRITDDKFPLNEAKLENLTVVGKHASEIAVEDLPIVVSEMRRVFQSNITRPLNRRREQLQQLMKLVQENMQDIAGALQKDLHKQPRGAYGEPMLALHSIRHMIENLESYNTPEIAGFSVFLPTATNMIVKEPCGTVLLHGIWNFPFELIFTPLAGAIAGGNNVIIKPCNTVPTCAKVMADLIHKYMDARFVQVVGGPGIPDDRECSDKLLDNHFDKIMFTGSPDGGRFVMQKAAQFLTPVLLELGGKNPSFVDSSADLELTAKELWKGRASNCGQVCISADYVLVERGSLDGLIQQLEKVKEATMDKWEDKAARLVNDAQFARVNDMVDGTGGKILFGGARDEQSRHFEPTCILLDGLPSRDDERDVGLSKETFGPVLWMVPVDNMQEAVEYVREQPKPLALYVFSNTQHTIDYVVGNTSSGAVMVNGTIGYFLHERIPFGGVGESGMGAYHGKRTFDAFTHEKGVVQKWNFELPPAIQGELMSYGMDH